MTKLPSWLSSTKKLNFQSLSYGFQDYLFKQTESCYNVKTPIQKYTPLVRKCIVEYLVTDHNKFLYEAKGYDQGYNIVTGDKFGINNDGEFIIFVLWIIKLCYIESVKNKWIKKNNKNEFTDMMKNWGYGSFMYLIQDNK